MMDYFLHVDLIVFKEDAVEFEKRVGDFLHAGAFAKIDPTSHYKLALGLKSADTFKYSPRGRLDSCTKTFSEARRKTRTSRHLYVDSRIGREKDAFRYIHLWRVQDLENLDLAKRMIECADYEPYTAIDELVVCEIQDFIRRINWLTPTPTIENVNRNTRFVRSTIFVQTSRII